MKITVCLAAGQNEFRVRKITLTSIIINSVDSVLYQWCTDFQFELTKEAEILGVWRQVHFYFHAMNIGFN